MARVVSIDFTGTETGTQFVRVPEGDYALEIVKVTGKKGEESGKPYLSIHFKLSRGDKRGEGKTVPHTASLQKKALWNLRNILEACGKPVPSKAVKIDLDKMPGWKCAGTVVDDEYEGRKKSVISAFFPLSDLGATSDGGDFEPGEESNEEEDLFGGEEKQAGKKSSGKKTSKKAEPEEETEEPAEEGDEANELFN